MATGTGVAKAGRKPVRQRATVAPAQAARTVARAGRTAGWTGVYDVLRRDILSLALAPGELLDEMSLSRRFGFSRSPIREALIRLAGDGLVVTLQNRTTIVAPVDIARFPSYVDALDVAQRVNTRLAAELRTDADLRAIETEQKAFIAAVASKDHLAMSETNKNFHMAIARAGKNAYMAAFYERLLDEGRRLLHLHFDYIERTRDGRLLTDEHEEMIEAIRARDVSLADRLAHAHSRQFRDNFLEFLKANYSAPIDFGAERP
ncbi:MAG: GntR family transcriptional regulator [Rhizobiales bacterium]|nr:GntR family transcriptional regulator [Hyphomicrobiales bacterium]